MGAIPIELGPYTEGVNLVDPPTKLSPNELRKCLNYRTGVRGDFYKRPGHGIYGASSQKMNGDALVSLLLRYYRSDGSKLSIGAAGGKLRKGDDTTGAWVDIPIDGAANSMSATNLADWMVHKNRVYITDGVKPQRYNNVDNIYAGHFIHAAPTLAQSTNPPSGSGLTLLKTYKYFVTSVTSDMGEGPAGAVATIVLSGTNNRVSLSAMAAAPAKHEETAKNIYRNKPSVGTGTLFYLLVQIPTGTTPYVDDIADTALGSEFIPTHIPPADARFCIMGHDERAYWFGMAGLNASLVQVSEPGFPDRIRDTESFFSVANNDGDICTGGGLVPGGIIFFKKTSLWLLRAFGFGLINIYPKEKRGSGVGTTSPFSIVTTPVGLIFLAQRGEVYIFDGTNLREIGRKIATEFRNMSPESLSKVVACYHDYRYIISYDYRSSKGYNWKTLEYDPIEDKWEGPNENSDFYTPSYYSVWDSVLDKGELAWGESKAAAGSFMYVRSEFTKTDRGNKFISTAVGGNLPLGKLGEVISTKIFVHGDFSSDASLSATHIKEDNSRITVDLSVTVPVTAGIYNVSKYNQAKYGGINAQVLEGPFGPEARARLPAYEISDGGTATESRMNIISLLAEVLPLK